MSSASGMTAQFTSGGNLRRLDVDGRSLLLYPASELEAGRVNLYLRFNEADARWWPLLGPDSGSKIQWTASGPLVTGCFRGLTYGARFLLAAGVAAWFWHVELRNTTVAIAEVNLLYAQDIALADYEAVRTNEYYVSQYLDVTPVHTDRVGIALGVRQNMPDAGAPWVLVGSLRDGTGWATDALQFGMLPNTRLQHEHTLVQLEDRPARLRPGEQLRFGFFGIYTAHHLAATSDDDAVAAALALQQREARPPELDGGDRSEPVVGSLFSPTALLECRDLSDAELSRLTGPGRHQLERGRGRPLSYFADDGTHVVLAAKERAVLRPHGHVLRTGNRLVPDEGSLTSTTWMAGIFHSQVTQGHAALNRILSTRRGYVGGQRADGLRVFVQGSDASGGWALLDAPSAWAVRPDRCTWWYRHGSGLIEVVAGAPAEQRELTLRLRVLEGEPCRFLLAAKVALGDDDGLDRTPPPMADDATGVSVRPPAGSAMDARFPNGSVRFSWPARSVEQVGRDAPLFLDGGSRDLPWVSIRTTPTRDFNLALSADLVPSADRAARVPGEPAWPQFWPGVRESIRLFAPPGSPLARDIEQLDVVLPWFAHNALVHYLSPRGLEQYSGGAWGTRDVCQGPVSLLIALGQTRPLRDLLSRVFRAQNQRGDWPQWFEFYPRHLTPGQRDAHGDVIFWPLLALAEYLIAGGDPSILDERLPFIGDHGATEGAPLLDHLERALARIASATIPGTPLPAYGNGDWNDSLRPADPALAARLCSTWTVTLQIVSLRALAGALRNVATVPALNRLADSAERLAAEAADAMHRLLFRDGVLAGYGLFRQDGSVEHLVHPSDQRTGMHYGLLHIISAISAGLLSADAAGAHLALLREHLLAPDGARLFDRPAAYRGGPMQIFQRAEASAFFGREIGLMYMHAHLRYAEMLAHYGDTRGVLEALVLANPIGLSDRLPAARPRQSTCYYTSSDAAFADRYQAAEEYDRVRRGEVALEGGWRVYSSGPGILLRLIVERLLGLRRHLGVLDVDPVLDPALDGLRARVPVAGVPMEVSFRVGRRGVGPVGVSINGVRLATKPLSNPYRPPGVSIDIANLRRHLRTQRNELAVEVS